jgi:RNA-directed DNA polymerase
VNAGASPSNADAFEARVLEIQAKLHQWASNGPERRFDDLYNLVIDPIVLAVAWKRVRSNRGARSAGVDGATARYITAVRGEEAFLTGLRADLKARTYRPQPVRERMIPKPNGKQRRLGIPTVRDRVVQAALKLVLEPIFEADFKPCSYGFRPGRRAQDAIAEIHYFASRSYEWVFEGDITACFDEISHSALMDRVRARVGDKRVLDLVKAFLKAGILSEEGMRRDTITGTPQGGILSPLLSNIALSCLDEHFAEGWEANCKNQTDRQRLRRKGQPIVRLERYADDFVTLVSGTCEHAEALRGEVAAVLQPMGLRLSETKTKIAHIDEGFDFLGFRIRRHQQRGSHKRYIYTYPSRSSLAAIVAKVRKLTREALNSTLEVLLYRLNLILRGWTNYFRHAASKKTFSYVDDIVWHRVAIWLRHKHPHRNWKWLHRHYLPGWRPAEGKTTLFDPKKVAIVRYRFRGATIPSPWSKRREGTAAETSA